MNMRRISLAYSSSIISVFSMMAFYTDVIAADVDTSPYVYHGKSDKYAFSHSYSFLTPEQKMDFAVGKGFFKRLWVTAPSSTQAADGLGPLFNARACMSCHPRNGRGQPPRASSDDAVSLVLRVDIPPQNVQQQTLLQQQRVNNIPDPIYGLQLQNYAIAGQDAESRLHISYQEMPVTLADGTVVSIRKPTYQVKQLAYGALHSEARLSPRVAQQLIGLGLLEAIPDEDIMAYIDTDDTNGDGISGRANRVWSHEHNKVMLGRFGHKAGMPSINQQSQAAFASDIGISTRLFPHGAGDCTEQQIKCLSAPNGNSKQYANVEAHEQVTDLVSFYLNNIAVPAQRNVDDKDVISGGEIFRSIGCHQCHIEQYVISADVNKVNDDVHTIYPYSDLLLHDMGEGLADHRPEGMANGYEWRTAPLWGIGLTPVVNGHSYYLHDGRARNLLEAILWHGGESQQQRDAVMSLSKKQRQQLLKFIESL